jgi:protocatechuate 3,4-dioxygenase beta subunit
MVTGPRARPAPATTSEQITANVLASVHSTPDARLRELVLALIRHGHDLAREVGLQPGELLAAADYLKRCGDISDGARHEFILLADVLGLTMVVDTLAAPVASGALESSVLGPFYRTGAPVEPNGADISRGASDGEPAHICGRVLDVDGRVVRGAELDVWGTNHDGLYENMDPAQPEYNLRGRFVTDEAGRYDLWTVKPVSYPIPDDGPVGDLLRATARHNMRPAHLHLIASAAGFRTVVTELYTDDDAYLQTDAVFGVKPSLVVHYDWIDEPARLAQAGRTTPFWELHHDIVLTAGESTAVTFSTARRESGAPTTPLTKDPTVS